MRKIILILLCGIVFTPMSLVSAQVGINVEKPIVTLEIIGKPDEPTSLDGVIPPRITGEKLRSKSYTEAQDGTIIYVTQADSSPMGQTALVTARGYYYFDGEKDQWIQLLDRSLEIFASPYKNVFSIAKAPVDITSSGVDLGIEVSIEIPAKKTVDIIVDYNVPLGSVDLEDSAAIISGYYGVTFLRKEGGDSFEEAPIGSRKIISIRNNGFGAKNSIAVVSGKYIETYKNITTETIKLTYKLRGYTENVNETIRFNMWSNTGDNQNWGKGSMTLNSYIY